MRFPYNLARALALGGLASIAASLGCDSGLPVGKHPVHPTEGQVLFEGKPLAGAQVSLLPVDETKFGDSIPRPIGQTDADGRFKLMTYLAGDGAPEGDYLVAIAGQARPMVESESVLNPKRNLGQPDPLKGRFLDPKTSGLKATIKPGPNTLEPFDLKASGGAAPAANAPVPTKSRDR